MMAESAGDPNAVSPKGATGLMQLMPATAKDPGFGVKPFDATKPLNDPQENMRVGTDYLNAMMERYGGDREAALAAYNWGPGNADKWIAAGRPASMLPQETRDYIARILGTGPAQGTSSPQPTRMAQAAPDLNSLINAADNPYLTKGQQAVLDALIKRQFETPDQPKSYEEYQLARREGFGGTYADWVKNKAQTVQIGSPQFGKIDPGYQLIRNPDGSVSMQPIPGSPAAQKLEAEKESAKSQEAARLESTAGKSRTMLDATRSIKEVIKNARTPFGGTESIPFTLYSETPASKVREYVRTLRSGVALNAIMRLKQASSTGATGFGQMNRAELQLLIDDIGVLNPDGPREVFVETVNRIEERTKRVVDDIKRNVSPERIKELNLGPLLEVPDEAPSSSDGTQRPPPEGVDPSIWQHMTPEERSLWQN